MYTSGTTGDPKGVMISNESILSINSGVNHHLESMNEEVWLFHSFSTYIRSSVKQYHFFFYLHILLNLQFSEADVFLSYLPLAHIFDRVIEELFISKGAAIGFWHKVSLKLEINPESYTLETSLWSS